ncbi:MAG: hypothetical protein OEY99_07150 [Aigarchaeota archaeon]|nr:hypothetical protein [Aigarchaeota archaeon]MDH5703977.1 hypothetical protein [Aigarchaeota archaeon]
MRIKARYKGRCRVCGGEINPGDEIEWTRSQGAAHAECATSTSEEPEE